MAGLVAQRMTKPRPAATATPPTAQVDPPVAGKPASGVKSPGTTTNTRAAPAGGGSTLHGDPAGQMGNRGPVKPEVSTPDQPALQLHSQTARAVDPPAQQLHSQTAPGAEGAAGRGFVPDEDTPAGTGVVGQVLHGDSRRALPAGAEGTSTGTEPLPPGTTPGTAAVNTRITNAGAALDKRAQIAEAKAKADADKAAAAAAEEAAKNPNLREVNEETDTVAGQLAKLTASNNPIIEQARAAAAKAANDRGMANSSMAVQSGEEAAIGSMLPVAQQDASTYFTQGRANQDTDNQFNLTKQGFDQQTQMQTRDIASNEKISMQQLAAARASADAQIQLGQAQIEASKNMQATSIAANERLAELDANTRLTLMDKQTLANTGMFDKQAGLQREINLQGINANTQNNYTAQITSILNNHEIGKEDKEQAIKNLNAIYAGSPYMPIGINLTGLPPVTAPPVNNTRPTDPGSGG